MPFLLLNPDNITHLPTSGPAWDRLVAKANTDPGTPNLSLVDQFGPAACLSVALRYAKDGGGLGKARCVKFVLDAMGTENSATQGLNFFRTVGTIFQIADLVGMTGAEVGANGQTFNAWAQTIPNKVIGKQTNWDTLWKCADTSANNWGACARTSLMAVALWLIKKGLNPIPNAAMTGVDASPTTAVGLRDAVISRFKRWCGDVTMPNTFKPSGDFQAAWAVNTFPSAQGAINPVTTLVKSGVYMDGANVEDGSRETFPTKGGKSEHYQYEAMESAMVLIAFLINAGYADAKTYGSNGVRRNAQYMMKNGLTTPDADYHVYFSMLWPVINWMWNIGFPSRTITGDQRRLMTTHTDWLTSSGSTWLSGASVGTDPGTGTGGTVTPVITAPNAVISMPTTGVAGTPVTINVSGSTPGSAAIVRQKLTFGDGTPQLTLTAPTNTTTHTFAVTAATRFTVTLLTEAADGGSDTATATILISPTVTTPVARFVLTDAAGLPLTPGVGPLKAYYDFTGSFDPSNRPFTCRVDWGDGTVSDNAPLTGFHIYAAVPALADWPVTATISAGTDVSTPISRAVTVLPASAATATATPYIVVDGQKVPLIPAYGSAWDGIHLVLGPYHLWFDSSTTPAMLRWKVGAPTGPTDGQAIGQGLVQPLGPSETVPSGTAAGTLFVLYR